jgi:hypothetical protein
MMLSKAEIMEEVERRLDILEGYAANEKHPAVGDEEGLRAQLEELTEALLTPDEWPEETWQEHELHWQAHGTELRRRLVVDCIYVMICFDTEDTRKPERYAGNVGVWELLHWWREQGGRQSHLGELPLEERRRLESLEAEYRVKEPKRPPDWL